MTSHASVVLIGFLASHLCASSAAQSTFLPGVRVGPGPDASSCLGDRAPFDAAFGDFNGDGATDIAFPFSLCPRISVTLSDGMGGYLAETTLPYSFGAEGKGPHAVEVMDVDGDGQQDIVTAFRLGTSNVGFIYWLRGTGSGTFEAPASLSGPIQGSLLVLRAIDLDGDGLEEIVTASQGGQEGLVLSRATAGTPFTRTTLFLSLGNGVGSLDVGDLDGDGDLDLVFGVKSIAQILALENHGPGGFGTPIPLNSQPATVERVAILDVDSDGQPDIAFSTAGFSNLGLNFLIQGAQPFGPWMFSPGPVDADLPFGSVSVGDIDLDGDDDILVMAQTFVPTISVGPKIYFNHGPLDFRPADYGWKEQGYSVHSGLYDLNGDGALDVVFPGNSAATLYTQVDPVAGDAFCAPTPNSTGSAGTLRALGSDDVAANNLRLVGMNLPPLEFGIGIVSLGENAGYQPAGTSGTLCLGTAQGAGLGRYDDPGEVFMISTLGLANLDLNLAQTPSPAGPMAAGPGDTLRFQLWHRDRIGTAVTSNFTAAVRVTLR